jgi:ligand-binding sensor domain-containing protein/serine phosphatase RsbU (regulator of sigma subunit)
MMKWRATIVISILFAALNVQAQTTSFLSYGVEQGLVQSQVQSIVQDNEGNLWIGTLAGLSRYNGRGFENFTRRNGLAEDWVTTSYKDAQGDIWFGHWAGGVSRYNSKSKKFESLNLEEYTRFRSVTAITEDQQGFFWIATEGAGIFIYDPAKNKMFSISVKDGLASENVYDLCLDGNGNMWIATDRGVTICDTRGDISSPMAYTDLNAERGFPSNAITSLALLNKTSEMWVGTADKGVIVLQLPNNFIGRNAPTLLPNLRVIGEEQGLTSSFIEDICPDSRGNIWLGTTGGGAVLITPFQSSNRLQAIDKSVVKAYNTRQGLNYFNVKKILEDREGNIWIGTDVGLNLYRGERFVLFDKRDGLSNDIVWTTLVDKSGNVWLGTNDGLTRLTFNGNASDSSFTVTKFGVTEGLRSAVVLSLFEDSRGTIWAGTGIGGVSKLEKGSSRFETYTTTEGLAGDLVYAINEDLRGNIWVGTKEGVSRIENGNGAIRNYSTDDGLGGNNVYRIFRDSKGNLWFGALGGYLSVYDGKAFTRYDESNGIIHRFILCINEDAQQNIWLGAYGGGLYKYDGRVFRNYTAKHGMSTETPYALIADGKNNIWIGNSRGLDVFNPVDSSFSHFGKSEGFNGVEVNPNAVFADKNGNLWFGTIMGAVRYSPGENRLNTVEPLTTLTGLKIFMRDAEFPESATFNYDQNHLTFLFNGVSLANPEKVRYIYKLEGFDKDWSPLPTAHPEAVYSNLPPGDYVFQVKACNNDGVWNKEAVTYKFTIQPPFWQTALFYVFVVLFVGFSLFGFDKWRTRKLKQQTRILEEKVAERTKELALKNEELAQKNIEVTDSIRYAKRLQDAMLQPSKDVRKSLQESFVLYKPKDIVSGDFYFMRQHGSRIYIAAVDCTGHGVPGAFMSIVTNDMLESVVENNPSDSAASLLDKLNRLMSDKMHHTIDDMQVRDGIDIALAIFNTATNELQYAGAYNQMYVFRDRRFTEYKGDKVSIGSYKEYPDKNYTNYNITLTTGDSFYLLSDGYTDQFGGPQGKKFKPAQLKAVLLTVQDHEMFEQLRVLDQTIETWRGHLEQVDDMLIIGVRV